MFETSFTTNPKGLTHNYGSPTKDPSLKHSRYNEEVLSAIKGEIKRLEDTKKFKGGKLSGDQAKNIVKRIKKDGLRNAYCSSLTAVLQVVEIGNARGIVASQGGNRQS